MYEDALVYTAPEIEENMNIMIGKHPHIHVTRIDSYLTLLICKKQHYAKCYVHYQYDYIQSHLISLNVSKYLWT